MRFKNVIEFLRRDSRTRIYYIYKHIIFKIKNKCFFSVTCMQYIRKRHTKSPWEKLRTDCFIKCSFLWIEFQCLIVTFYASAKRVSFLVIWEILCNTMFGATRLLGFPSGRFRLFIFFISFSGFRMLETPSCHVSYEEDC